METSLLRMMKLLCGGTLILTLALSYYVYMPLPATVSEPWKLMLVGATFRTATHLADVSHSLGLAHHIRVLSLVVTSFERLVPAEFEDIQMEDTEFDGVQVRVYTPQHRDGTLRPAVVFIHGGGWALGVPKLGSYDVLCRKMAVKLNAVVVTVDYRMAPDVRFPVQYEECVQAARHFLQRDVLARYSVDPDRVAVCGDSAGGNLAAAVAQRIAQDSRGDGDVRDSSSDNVKSNSKDDDARNSIGDGGVKFKLQVLIYPVLQPLDFNTASYQQNRGVPILYRDLMARYWLEYLGADAALLHTILLNNHTALDESRANPHRSKVDWTSMIPEHMCKQYTAIFPQTGSPSVLQDVPAMLDPRAAPLLAEQEILQTAPSAYIMTCEHDVLRDDGMMYVHRLEHAGVSVTHRHYEDCFHGCVSFAFWPSYFSVGIRAIDDYIAWLHTHL
ncbi:neutral cholesterol ester hydrolase 1a [Pangasianodon hypophthalmus]|uniref:neutral cholesterol ester hydrolase 1a n=1 Tax=Pangasianodon hypophthalmus TaxID=310915 RepID=UPI002307D22A|nr:neutral cholesterol ester hydrolase 1a [Pangasianodon hypophthalmus]